MSAWPVRLFVIFWKVIFVLSCIHVHESVHMHLESGKILPKFIVLERAPHYFSSTSSKCHIKILGINVTEGNQNQYFELVACSRRSVSWETARKMRLAWPTATGKNGKGTRHFSLAVNWTSGTGFEFATVSAKQFKAIMIDSFETNVDFFPPL